MAAISGDSRTLTIGLPRMRVMVAFAAVIVFGLVVFAVMWGPLSNRQPQAAQVSAATLLNQGLAAQVAGRQADAINLYHQTIAKDPNNYWAYYNLGVIDQIAGRGVTAEQEYRTALRINPDFVPALYNLAILRTAVSPTEAEDLYRHAIAVQPTSATAHLNLGFLLLQEGKKAEGQQELATAVKLDPSLASRVAAPTAGTKH